MSETQRVAMHDAAAKNPDAFWRDEATRIAWMKAPTKIKNTDFNGNALVIAAERPDGYPLVPANAGPMAVAQTLFPNLAYDVRRSFSYVMLVGGAPMVVGVRPNGLIQTMTDYLSTGHEQVRSIAAFVACDPEAERRVRLVPPQTGMCSTDRAPDAAASCCTPATPQGVCCDAKPERVAEAPCYGPAVAPVQEACGCCG